MGPGMAETGAGGVDQGRVAVLEVVPAVAELLHRAGAEILSHHVGTGQQRLEDGAVAIVLEVERNALLAAVDGDEIGGLAVDERAVFAGVVAAAGRFHLDDAGAELGKDHRAVRSRQHTGEVDDGDAAERPLDLLGRHGQSGSRLRIRRPSITPSALPP